MESSVEPREIVLLFDTYTWKSQCLHESFLRGGYDVLAIVLEENDFLPANVISVYDLMIGNCINGKIVNAGKPRYFNEIMMPDTWGISADEEDGGRITYWREEKGKIHYVESAQNPLVKAVDWDDRKGVTRFRDHYNRYGDICARTTYDATGAPMSKSWLSPEGHEVVMENYVTGDFVLSDRDATKIFRTKMDLRLYYLKKLGFEQKRIFFNTLSTPFLLSNRLGASLKEDVLFWQEMAGNEIPGNMRMILEGRAGRVGKIVVQTRSSYKRLLELGASEDKIHELGFILSFVRENEHRNEALICTESDKIEHCEELINALPQMHFHIAAQTWMSQKLFELDKYENVSLYPGAKMSILDELFGKCDYYFDINYRSEIVSAVYKAFLNKQLIFAFHETAHNRDYTAAEHIYLASEFGKMVVDVQKCMESEDIMEVHLKKQWTDALVETKESYAQVLGL